VSATSAPQTKTARTPSKGSGPSAASEKTTATPKGEEPQTLRNPIVNRPKEVDPFVFWKDYYRKNDTPPADLLANLVVLRNEKQFRDIQAALTGYLTFRAKPPEIWMYEMLAVAIEKNGGRKEDVESSLGYAAAIAKKRGSVIDLTRVADLLHIHHMDAKAAELLPLAMKKDPSDPRPPLMAINLATLLKDPELMGTAAERLLSLGWPGVDETWRIDVRKNAEALAKTLASEGRSEDAEALRKRVAAADYRDLFLRLTWNGDAGLDLAVEEPLGATATVLEPRTVFGGAIVKSGRGKHPESVYVCPRGFNGDYRIKIQTLYNDEKKPARDVTLEIITHEGTPEEETETRTIDLAKSEPTVVHLNGGTRKSVLPYQAPRLSVPKPVPFDSRSGTTTPAKEPKKAP